MGSDIFFANSVAQDLNNVFTNIQNIQSQMATGLKVSQPSDNPAVWGESQILALNQSALANDGTLAGSALSVLQSAGTALQQASQTLQQAISLATEGSNGTLSASNLSSLASTAQGLLNQLVNAANFQYDGASVFAGTASNVAAYNASGDYQGNSGSNSVTFSDGTSVALAFNGKQVFGDAASNTGAMGAISGLISALSSDSPSAVAATLPQLQAALTTLGNFSSALGGSQQLLQSVQNQASATNTQMQNNQSNLVDANLAKDSTALSLAELQQQALVGLASTIARSSLINVLA
jgi:flagellar hook-associated protein 3 FlgL